MHSAVTSQSPRYGCHPSGGLLPSQFYLVSCLLSLFHYPFWSALPFVLPLCFRPARSSLFPEECHTAPYCAILCNISCVNLVDQTGVVATAGRCFFGSRKGIAVPPPRSLVYLVKKWSLISHPISSGLSRPSSVLLLVSHWWEPSSFS